MNKKKILSLIMALVMLVGVFSPLTALAEGETKVRIHKILMDKKELEKPEWPKDHDGSAIENIQEYFGAEAKEIDGVAFRIYEVYTGEEPNPEGYTKGSDLTTTHKLATGDLEADKFYKLVQVGGKDFVTTANGGVAEVTLPDGTYRVVEDKAHSTYKGDQGGTLTESKAVPFDLVLPAGLPDGTGNYSVEKPLNVYPKNVESPVRFDKNFAKTNGLEAITDPNTLKDVGAVMDNYEKEKANAKAEIGKEIPYEAKAELPKGAVFTNLDLADSMDKGLKYNADKKVTITVEPALDKALEENTDYTVTNVGNGFKVHFEQKGLDKLNKAAEAKDLSITFTYSATVTADAIVDKPMDNHATITYNHVPPQPSSDKFTPVNKEIKVTKTWADGAAPTDITVKYVLLDENDMPVADVTFKNATTVDGTDLGNGITFKVTGDYAGTFKGLEDGKNYKVKEIVNGYEPGYTVAKDTATVTVNNTKTPNSITPTPPQVTVGGKKFVKTDKEGTARLAGAEFVIQNKNEGANADKYLKITEKDATTYATAEKAYNDAIKAVNDALAKGEISDANKANIAGQEYDNKDAAMAKVEELRVARDNAFTAANLSYTWVEEAKKATTFTSNDKGQFEVKGLEYGDYRAVETKAPAGYALPTNGGNFTFKVGDGTYTGSGNIDYVADSAANDAMQITNNKVSIPQTGGIGTVIFTVVGIGLMAGAVIAMRKNRGEA
ncbi:isopeptide-forming domain-containing fimbrial protein [Peptoniphilus sp. AGMB00490]|uniref:Isopeptide-forming domain-containing fimbrial protein n=1 Tax=Peptoniphilus faecalis TaxID=2731255 RepID=A0A848RL21_9FIRM|nr:SpaA isopeptide-forming pilin-related protein [Peptoniphilus faecalis]NMW85022.1 isopeptide-forming domain-containing fimbrial protein [Peptoniphilus faecalis]